MIGRTGCGGDDRQVELDGRWWMGQRLPALSEFEAIRKA